MLAAELRAAIPDLALTTDIIVGFPGETDRDFAETLEVGEEVGYDGAFTFVYSPRQGTEAATMPDQIPEETKRERIERLVELVQRIARSETGSESADGGGAGRGAEPDRSGAPARAHPPQHDGQLRRHGPLEARPRRSKARPRPPSRHRSRPLQRSRDLVWDGLLNVRDLGGHPTEDGAETRFGAIVRADSVRQLSDEGWGALVDYGIRTVVDLRGEQELEADPPAEVPIEVLHVPFMVTDGAAGRRSRRR